MSVEEVQRKLKRRRKRGEDQGWEGKNKREIEQDNVSDRFSK